MDKLVTILVTLVGMVQAQTASPGGDGGDAAIWSDVGDCCTFDNSRKGCSNAAITQCVCDFDLYTRANTTRAHCCEDRWSSECVHLASFCLKAHDSTPCTEFQSCDGNVLMLLSLLPWTAVAACAMAMCSRRLARRQRVAPVRSDPYVNEESAQDHPNSAIHSQPFSLSGHSKLLFAVQCAWSPFCGARLAKSALAKGLVVIAAVLLALRVGMDIGYSAKIGLEDMCSGLFQPPDRYLEKAIGLFSMLAMTAAMLQFTSQRILHRLFDGERWRAFARRWSKVHAIWMGLLGVIVLSIGNTNTYTVREGSAEEFFQNYWPEHLTIRWLDWSTFTVLDFAGVFLRDIPLYSILLLIVPRLVMSFRSIARRTALLASSNNNAEEGAIIESDVEALWREYVKERNLCDDVARVLSAMLIASCLDFLWGLCRQIDGLLFASNRSVTESMEGIAEGAVIALFLLITIIPALLVTASIRGCLLAFDEVAQQHSDASWYTHRTNTERKRGAGLRLFDTTLVFGPRLVFRMLYLAMYFLMLSGLVDFVSLAAR